MDMDDETSRSVGSRLLQSDSHHDRIFAIIAVPASCERGPGGARDVPVSVSVSIVILMSVPLCLWPCQTAPSEG